MIALVLTLTAIQYVIGERLPSSSYITPLMLLIIVTYCLLFFIALESIFVSALVNLQPSIESKEVCCSMLTSLP